MTKIKRKGHQQETHLEYHMRNNRQEKQLLILFTIVLLITLASGFKEALLLPTFILFVYIFWRN